MKKEDESYESVNLSNTTATKPGWLLYYILETYQLIKSISGKQKKSISGKFGQDLMTSCEKLIGILKNEPAVSRGGQRLGPWGKGDKNPPWGGGCVLQSAFFYY